MNRIILTYLRDECIRHGDFTLASGKKSSYYLDVKKLTLSPLLNELCRAIVFHLAARTGTFDAVAGMETAANQLVGAYCCYMGHFDTPIRGGIVKKSVKDHGLNDPVIGSIKKGDRVVLLEDVATTGSSMMNAAVTLQLNWDCHIVHALAIVDRLEGAAEMMKRANIPYSSLFTAGDLLKR
jgi:orotate phosphoribosyltransferase